MSINRSTTTESKPKLVNMEMCTISYRVPSIGQLGVGNCKASLLDPRNTVVVHWWNWLSNTGCLFVVNKKETFSLLEVSRFNKTTWITHFKIDNFLYSVRALYLHLLFLPWDLPLKKYALPFPVHKVAASILSGNPGNTWLIACLCSEPEVPSVPVW